jgi:hypothetical protein
MNELDVFEALLWALRLMIEEAPEHEREQLLARLAELTSTPRSNGDNHAPTH